MRAQDKVFDIGVDIGVGVGVDIGVGVGVCAVAWMNTSVSDRGTQTCLTVVAFRTLGSIGWVGKTKILKHTQFLCQF